MAQCLGRSNDGSPCPRQAQMRSNYCELHAIMASKGTLAIHIEEAAEEAMTMDDEKEGEGQL